LSSLAVPVKVVEPMRRAESRDFQFDIRGAPASHLQAPRWRDFKRIPISSAMRKMTLLAVVGLGLALPAVFAGGEECAAAKECTATTAAKATSECAAACKEGEVALQLKGVNCEGCASEVKTAFLKLKGVKAAKICVESKTATVEFDPAKFKRADLVADLVAAVKKAGYGVIEPETKPVAKN